MSQCFQLWITPLRLHLLHLAKVLEEKEFILVDCQVHTNHLESLGAVNMPREKFFEIVEKGIGYSSTKIVLLSYIHFFNKPA